MTCTVLELWEVLPYNTRQDEVSAKQEKVAKCFREEAEEWEERGTGVGDSGLNQVSVPHELCDLGQRAQGSVSTSVRRERQSLEAFPEFLRPGSVRSVLVHPFCKVLPVICHMESTLDMTLSPLDDQCLQSNNVWGPA